MAKTKNANSALPYAQRLLEDEYVQEQLGNAVLGLRHAYVRATHKRAQATEDKKLYASLRRAATSVRNATIALRRVPEPPPKHRGRDVLIIALAIGATVWMAKLAQRQKEAVSSDVRASSDDVGATAGDTVAPESIVAPS